MDKWNYMSNKPDPSGPEEDHDRRPLRTKQALIDALIGLMSVKHYEAISIKDIVDKANVGRSTFYVYYKTKDDLLQGGFERILDMLVRNIEFNESGQDFQLDTTFLFQHARGHYELFRTLLWGSGYKEFARSGHALLCAKLEERLSRVFQGKDDVSVPLPILAYSMAGSLLTLLQWWLENKMPYSPERMNEIFQGLVMTGIRNTLGLDHKS
jgi:AcrR family transcriptional regulator